ncbi:MAG: hypothetical protein ABIK10_00385 [candidate division WOR-3 bacterium]
MPKWIWIGLTGLFTISPVYGQVDLNSILNGVFTKYDRIARELQDAICYGDFYYLETDDKGETLKIITAKRKIYSKGFHRLKSEYLEMTENNKLLSKQEIARRLRSSRGEDRSYLPFEKEFRNQYNFYLLGDETYNGLSVWVIGFNPKRKGRGYIQGQAKISKKDSSIIALSFVPTGLPFVIKDFKITLDYGWFGNYWMPQKFLLKMELDVKVLVSLVHKHITVHEEYYGYTFNNGLLDSFFE